MKCLFSNCSSESCCENPGLGLGVLRIAVVMLFFPAGIMKLMNPEMIIGMVQNNVGISGTLGVLLAWAVIATEVGGSIFVLLGNKVPRVLYKLSLLGFMVVLLVAILTVHAPGGDMMAILSHILMLASVFSLMVTTPTCLVGATGKKA